MSRRVKIALVLISILTIASVYILIIVNPPAPSEIFIHTLIWRQAGVVKDNENGVMNVVIYNIDDVVKTKLLEEEMVVKVNGCVVKTFEVIDRNENGWFDRNEVLIVYVPLTQKYFETREDGSIYADIDMYIDQESAVFQFFTTVMYYGEVTFLYEKDGYAMFRFENINETFGTNEQLWTVRLFSFANGTLEETEYEFLNYGNETIGNGDEIRVYLNTTIQRPIYVFFECGSQPVLTGVIE